MTSSKRFAGIILLSTTFFVLGFIRLNDLTLYQDSVLNVLWGTALAQGKGFIDETQPIPSPTIVETPLYPIILTPSFMIFPHSLITAKILTLFFGCCAIVSLYLLLTNFVSESLAFASTTLFALSPLTLLFATEAIPELLFISVFLLVFYVSIPYFRGSLIGRKKLLFFVLVSLLPLLHWYGYALSIALTIVLFSENKKYDSGTVLLLTIFLVGLLILRNTSMGTSAALPIFSYLIHQYTPPDAPFIVELWQRILHNGVKYLFQCAGVVFFTVPTNVLLAPLSFTQLLLSIIDTISVYSPFIFVPLIFIGLTEEWKSSSGKVRVLFFIISLGIVVTTPRYDFRIIFPLVPLILLFSIRGFSHLINAGKVSLFYRYFGFTVFVTILLPNVFTTIEMLRSNITYLRSADRVRVARTSYESFAYYSKPWERIGKWFSANVPQGTVVVAPSKEVSLYAPHIKLLVLTKTVPVPIFESSIRMHQAEFLVVPFVVGTMPEYAIQTTEGVRCSYELIATHGQVGIYKIHYRNLSLLPFPESNPQSTADSLYRSLRKSIHSEQYTTALYTLHELKNHYPFPEDLHFHKLLINVFSQNDSLAQRDFRILTRFPHASPYIPLARSFLETLTSYKNAREAKNPVAASDELFRISQFYLNTGYTTQAERLLNEALSVDSANFIGLLWALHLSIQNGSPNTLYLQRLTSLESTNILVQAFHRILRVRDSLAHARTFHEYSRIDSVLANIYQTIGLPNEAIDYGEKSIAYDPTNSNRWFYLGQLYEEQGAPLAAYKLYKKTLEIDSSHTQARLSIYRIKKGL
ncbi:MAG: hypothetical protein N3A63_08320 [Bacteroidetes bacterium]|nr:hypothetical protein [Bacteroidota bacterium]